MYKGKISSSFIMWLIIYEVETGIYELETVETTNLSLAT